jgi:proteasome lid subunit RPN8/RPN11
MTTQARPFLLEDLSDEIRERVYDHVFAHDDTEVGGVLVGDIDATGRAEVHGMIPALEADGARASVTFTHEAWQAILDVHERDFPDSPVIVGWYHSHPGFGIFLSEHDIFIHKSFFREPFQLAYVVDPQDETEGIFGWRDGEIVLFEQGRTPRRRGKRRPTMVISLEDVAAARAEAELALEPEPEAPTVASAPIEVVPDDEPPVADEPAVAPPRRRRGRAGLVGLVLAIVAIGAAAVGIGMSGGSSSSDPSTGGVKVNAANEQPLDKQTAAEIARGSKLVREQRAEFAQEQAAYDAAKRTEQQLRRRRAAAAAAAAAAEHHAQPSTVAPAVPANPQTGRSKPKPKPVDLCGLTSANCKSGGASG